MSIELEVQFLRRIYGTPDGGFSVFAADVADTKYENLVSKNRFDNFTISGDFALEDDELNMTYKVTIEEDYNSKYPNSYKLLKIHYELPTEPKEQWKYLKDSNIVPIMKYLDIADEFDKNTKILDLILEDPLKLKKVKGIGKKRALIYHDRLLKNKDKALVFAAFGNIEGFGAKTIQKITEWRPDTEKAIKDIKKDPFCLLEDEIVGFMTADKIRDQQGIPLNDKNRILHGVSYFLQENFQNSGNTYEEITRASKDVSSKLQVRHEETILLLAEIQHNEIELNKYSLKIFGRNITTKSLFNAELLTYHKTKSMLNSENTITSSEKWKQIKDDVLSNFSEELSDEQDKFIDLLNEERISVLLGPGGSGKSWLINIACEMIGKAGKTYGLYAPTARAAHVMGEYANSPASTIHRGLMPLVLSKNIAEEDVIIIDEFSMVDSELASVVMKAIGEKTRLIIVGDDFQLQSVGPGNMLYDIVNHLEVPTINLTKIFRQSEDSGILDYAEDLRSGSFRLNPGEKSINHDDIVFINESNDERQKQKALDIYKKSIDNYDSEDVMLLSPTNRGTSGRTALNKEVQKIVNPEYNEKKDVVFGASLEEKDKIYFKKYDYITVKKNNYDMETDTGELRDIINGDLGTITNTNKSHLTFAIEGDSYTIEKSEIHEIIEHAWSITIHKSQGGQASEVIIVIPNNSYLLLNANMLYTAMTRAKVRCHIIGDFSGINSAAKKQVNFTRKTMIELQATNNSKS